MAFKKNIEAPNGVVQTYHKVMSFSYNGEKVVDEEGVENDHVLVNAVVGFYLDEEARNSGKQPVTQKQYSGIDINLGSQKNWIKQVYESLISIPDFEGSTEA